MKIKRFDPKSKYPIRAPYEHQLRLNADGYSYHYVNDVYEMNLKKFKIQNPELYKSNSMTVLHRLAKILYMLHARGDPIKEITERAVEAIKYTEYKQKEFPQARLVAGSPVLHTWGSLAIFLLLIPDSDMMSRFSKLIKLNDNERLYALEVLLKAFIPRWKMAKKFGRKGMAKFQLTWADPFIRALASDDREVALNRYMLNYQQYIKPLWPFGWKPWKEFEVEYSPDGEAMYGNAFHHFAFEVALAVCAYDLDDSSFRDHPYYPRDIVDHYREYLRYSRDSWRPEGVGAAMTIEPHTPKKIDLTKSKSKNFKRWIELVGDGNSDATKAVTTAFRGLRKIKCPYAVFEELSANEIAICVDLKDDVTLDTMLQALFKYRQIEIYDEPVSVFPAGTGRCQRLLEHVDQWLIKQDYSLFIADMQADSWGVVLVQNKFKHEFKALSEKLGISWMS
jgi:hypothetical protein